MSKAPGNPFPYLIACAAKNRILSRIRRLRQPRYLLGALFGCLYLYSVFFRRIGRGGAGGALFALPMSARETVELAAGAALFLIAAIAWIWPRSGKPALNFSRAEAQFLFPAPFARRDLIRYHVMRSQVATLVSSLIFTVFLRPNRLAGAWMGFVGAAFIMGIVSLHLTGVSLTQEKRSGEPVFLRFFRRLPAVVMAAAAAILAGAVAANWARLSTLGSLEEVLRELGRIASSGPAMIVLFPFRSLAALPLAPSPSEFFKALPIPATILVLNYLWVVSSDASFEEASAENAKRVDQLRQGRRALLTPRANAAPRFLSLGAAGRPEAAIIWKNLILLGRYSSGKVLLRVLFPLVIWGFFFTRFGARGGLALTLAPMCFMFTIIVLLLGPQFARNDLRQDLLRLALLKTWPLKGFQIVVGEWLAPAILLSLAAWALILAGILFMPPSGELALEFARAGVGRWPFAIAAMALAPGILGIQLLFHNGLAVLFPAWVSLGPGRTRGIEMMGQRFLIMAAMLLALLLALLPAAVGAGIMVFLERLLIHSNFILPPAGAAALILAVECALISLAVGKALDNTDVSAVEPADL